MHAANVGLFGERIRYVYGHAGRPNMLNSAICGNRRFEKIFRKMNEAAAQFRIFIEQIVFSTKFPCEHIAFVFDSFCDLHWQPSLASAVQILFKLKQQMVDLVSNRYASEDSIGVRVNEDAGFYSVHLSLGCLS